MLVSNEAQLAAFRAHWTGRRMLDLLVECGGRLLVDWEVGVGKSHAIDAIVTEAVGSADHDLVIVLCPTRRVIDERAWIISPPDQVRVVNIRPRPAQRCGTQRDAQWRGYERKGLGALGRHRVCRTCPSRQGCYWPKQYGSALAGADVVFATQAHLERSSTFINELLIWTRASRPLILIDEFNFLATCTTRVIEHDHLSRFGQTIQSLDGEGDDELMRRWRHYVDVLLAARTTDLRYPDWATPPIYPGWSLRVQDRGQDHHGDLFRFLGFDLVQFGRADATSRAKSSAGEITFAAPPLIDADTMIFSATSQKELASFRFGHDLATPFENYRFLHDQTRWMNIASRLGMRCYFQNNCQ